MLPLRTNHRSNNIDIPKLINGLFHVTLVASLLAPLLVVVQIPGGLGIVVDGTKKVELSATKNESHNEQTSIDPFNVKTCGISDPNFKEHEFVSMAREGQFPWIVSFQIKVSGNSTFKEHLEEAKNNNTNSTSPKKQQEDLHFCCGSFISDRWILSAAHCFVGDTIKNYLENDKLKVVAGSHKVSSRSPLNRNLTIERIYIHSKFDKSMPLGFDLALVELRDQVTFEQRRQQNEFGEQKAPFVNAICLPLTGKSYQSNETARLAGWGLSSANDASSMPSKLLTTDILISNQDECVTKYVETLKSDKPKEHKEKYNDFICANYKTTRDACQSDSGGPLMQFTNKKAIVVGVVSYGIGCATKGVPGVYTRTSAYINWIKDITTNGKSASVDFNLIEARNGSEQKQPNSSPSSSTTTTTTTTGRPGGSASSTPPTTTSTSTTSKPSHESSLSLSSSTSDSESDFKFFDE